jgi:diaminopimelate epimerase
MASSLGMVNGKAQFNAYDGLHTAQLLPLEIVKLKMSDVRKTEKRQEDFFINTGSPHHIRFVNNIQQFPVFDEGKKIRYSDDYKPGGTNVNFVELLSDNTIYVRTYERGVEDETLSCGTGVVAAALAASFKGYLSPVKIKTLGGDLSVEFRSTELISTNRQEGTFQDVFLIGPAKLVFEGDLEL